MVTWGIWCVCVYMRVFLFRLSPRRTNLMNLQSELVEVFFTLVFKACLMSHFSLCVPILTTQFSMHVSRLRFINTRVLDFGFTTDSLITIYITGHCLHLRAWITSLWSCTRVTACARYLALSFVPAGLFLITPDLHVHILKRSGRVVESFCGNLGLFRGASGQS